VFGYDRPGLRDLDRPAVEIAQAIGFAGAQDAEDAVDQAVGDGAEGLLVVMALAACQRGVKTRFVTAAAIVHEMIEAQDDKRLMRLQKTLASYELLIIDELGFVPLSRTGAELLFELISQRYERGATIITSNLPFDERTATFGDERLTGALLDRLTHHVHILEMNGPSYRLAQSRSRKSPD
jgi:DNA replication protein DnaC